MEDKEILSSELPEKITKADFENDFEKGKVWYYLKTVLYLLLSAGLVAFAAHCLIEPNEFTIGGVSGIAIMVSYATKGAIPQSVIVFFINLPLVIVAFFFVKKKFAVLTLSNIVLQSIFLLILENCGAPRIEFAEGTRIFSSIASGVCIGAAIAFAFKVGGSTGGVDIVAVIIQKKCPAPSIAWMIFFVSAIIIGASFFVFYNEKDSIAINLLPIMMSLFEVYVESKTNDSLTNGFESAIEFRIITDKPEEMSLALMKELSRGVTEIPATGMYTKEKHSMLLCVISRRQVNALRRIMKQIDPNAFAVMSGVSQVLGLGFFSSEH
ncbi:MAG: YitT family protein [Clostridia bacterium]|nr:YitT family protein [Clostridia bacterium]